MISSRLVPDMSCRLVTPWWNKIWEKLRHLCYLIENRCLYTVNFTDVYRDEFLPIINIANNFNLFYFDVSIKHFNGNWKYRKSYITNSSYIEWYLFKTYLTIYQIKSKLYFILCKNNDIYFLIKIIVFMLLSTAIY